MLFRSRRGALTFGNDHTLLNALLLLICAVMSALGAEILAILLFVPVAVIAQRVLCRWEEHHHTTTAAPSKPADASHSNVVRGL